MFIAQSHVLSFPAVRSWRSRHIEAAKGIEASNHSSPCRSDSSSRLDEEKADMGVDYFKADPVLLVVRLGELSPGFRPHHVPEVLARC